MLEFQFYLQIFVQFGAPAVLHAVPGPQSLAHGRFAIKNDSVVHLSLVSAQLQCEIRCAGLGQGRLIIVLPDLSCGFYAWWCCRWRRRGRLGASPGSSRWRQSWRCSRERWLAWSPDDQNKSIIDQRFAKIYWFVDLFRLWDLKKYVYLFAIMLGCAVAEAKRAGDEVILDVNHQKDTDWTHNLKPILINYFSS